MGKGYLVLNVVCCLWGDWPSKGWGPEYVARLKRGVERNLTVPHRFICFADDVSRVPEGIEARPLISPSWAGCLPKLYVYSPQARLQGRVLLFDLDNVITGSLDDMASFDGPMAVRAALPMYDQGERVADGDMIGFEAGSKTAQKLWDKFASDPNGAALSTGGRERFFIRETVEPDLWQDIVPGQVFSYKQHCKVKLPRNARIVSFHGNPRPHVVNHKWVREAWR